MKYCPKCKSDKPREEFYKASKAKDGLQGYCKVCVRAISLTRKDYRKSYRKLNSKKSKDYRKQYTLANKDKITMSNKQYREDNKERVKLSQKTYKENNYDKVLESSRKYREKNKPKYAKYRSARRAVEARATPSWLTEEHHKRMELMWGLRELKSFVNGTEYEVDHIVPLNGVTVCGLHVPWNLQLLPKTENRKKQHRMWPGMWDEETTILSEVD